MHIFSRFAALAALAMISLSSHAQTPPGGTVTSNVVATPKGLFNFEALTAKWASIQAENLTNATISGTLTGNAGMFTGGLSANGFTNSGNLTVLGSSKLGALPSGQPAIMQGVPSSVDGALVPSSILLGGVGNGDFAPTKITSPLIGPNDYGGCVLSVNDAPFEQWARCGTGYDEAIGIMEKVSNRVPRLTLGQDVQNVTVGGTTYALVPPSGTTYAVTFGGSSVTVRPSLSAQDAALLVAHIRLYSNYYNTMISTEAGGSTDTPSLWYAYIWSWSNGFDSTGTYTVINVSTDPYSNSAGWARETSAFTQVTTTTAPGQNSGDTIDTYDSSYAHPAVFIGQVGKKFVVNSMIQLDGALPDSPTRAAEGEELDLIIGDSAGWWAHEKRFTIHGKTIVLTGQDHPADDSYLERLAGTNLIKTGLTIDGVIYGGTPLSMSDGGFQFYSQGDLEAAPIGSYLTYAQLGSANFSGNFATLLLYGSHDAAPTSTVSGWGQEGSLHLGLQEDYSALAKNGQAIWCGGCTTGGQIVWNPIGYHYGLGIGAGIGNAVHYGLYVDSNGTDWVPTSLNLLAGGGLGMIPASGDSSGHPYLVATDSQTVTAEDTAGGRASFAIGGLSTSGGVVSGGGISIGPGQGLAMQPAGWTSGEVPMFLATDATDFALRTTANNQSSLAAWNLTAAGTVQGQNVASVGTLNAYADIVAAGDITTAGNIKGNASLASIIPEGHTAPRTLSSLADDTYSLRNYGVALDGTDTASAINTAMAAMGDGAIVDIPSGATLPSGYVFPASTGLGAFIRAGSTSLLSSGGSAGDGNLIERYENGNHEFYRSYTNDTNTRPLVWYDYTNNLSSAVDGGNRIDNTGVMINVHTTPPGGYGSMNGQQIFVYSGAQYGYGGFDIGETNTVYKTGTNWTWNGVFQSSRTAHTPVTYDGTTAESHDYNLEIDMSGSGPDLSASAYDPMTSAKDMLLLSSWADSSVQWTPNTAISAGDARSYQINGVGQLFVATVGGTTGASAPTWVVDHSQTFTDGTVTWQYSTLVSSQIGGAIRLTSQQNNLVSYGTFLSSDATFYNAVLDFSKASFSTSTHTVLRMPANAGIDFSADGTSAGQNNHWLGYVPEYSELAYTVAGEALFYVADDGTLWSSILSSNTLKVSGSASITGTLIIPYGTPASSSAACTEGQMEMDASYMYSCGPSNTWLRTSRGSTW